MQVFWFIPTHGDSRYLGTAEGARQVDHAYPQQVAVAADTLGYEGVLIPTGRSCEDPWIVAASLIPVTKRLRFLVAVRPGLMAPTLAARMAATYDRLSQGRLQHVPCATPSACARPIASAANSAASIAYGMPSPLNGDTMPPESPTSSRPRV